MPARRRISKTPEVKTTSGIIRSVFLAKTFIFDAKHSFGNKNTTWMELNQVSILNIGVNKNKIKKAQQASQSNKC